MKVYIILIITIITIISCKAQSVILNMETYNIDQMQDGMYLKDINNNLNKFNGIWKWEDGNSSFTIKFNKIEMIEYPNGDFYDLIVGRYKYIINGTVIIDNLNNNFNNDYLLYPIHCSYRKSNNSHLGVSFRDFENDKSGRGHIKIDTATNPHQILWSVIGNSKILIDNETSNNSWSLPVGNDNEKVLIKQ